MPEPTLKQKLALASIKILVITIVLFVFIYLVQTYILKNSSKQLNTEKSKENNTNPTPVLTPSPAVIADSPPIAKSVAAYEDQFPVTTQCFLDVTKTEEECLAVREMETKNFMTNYPDYVKKDMTQEQIMNMLRKYFEPLYKKMKNVENLQLLEPEYHLNQLHKTLGIELTLEALSGNIISSSEKESRYLKLYTDFQLIRPNMNYRLVKKNGKWVRM